MGLLRAYNHALATRPLLTQMISSGVIGAGGDTICQLAVEKRRLDDYDFMRTVRFFLLPAFYIAPTLSRWFRVLERSVNGSEKWAPLKRVIADQTLFAPIFSASIIMNLRILEGHSVQDSWQKLCEDYWPIYKRSIQYWPCVQLLNFYYVPLQYRVIVVQFAALLWNVFLSHKTQSKLPVPPLE